MTVASASKTIVFVSNRMPYPAPSGNLRYMHSLILFLESRGHRIEIVLPSPRVPFIVSRLGRYQLIQNVRVRAPGIYRVGKWHVVLNPIRVVKIFATRVLYLLPHRQASAIRKKIFRLLHGPDKGIGSAENMFIDPAQNTIGDADRSFVVAALERIDPDAIFFDTAHCSTYCGGLRTSATRYVITHDVIHRRHESFLDRGIEIWPRPIGRDEEARLLNEFDVVIAIQQEERDIIKEMLPDQDVITIPYGVDLVTRDDAEEVAGRCLFVGSQAQHNIEGLHWFLNKIWPEVIARVPGAHLHVCGSVCQEMTGGPGVELRGELSDLTEEYAHASLGIVCLKSGSGLKIKIVEALSHGLPCVTTSIGAQGLEQFSEMPFVVADTVDSFADNVAHLLEDPSLRQNLKYGIPQFCAQFAPVQVFAELSAMGF